MLFASVAMKCDMDRDGGKVMVGGKSGILKAPARCGRLLNASLIGHRWITAQSTYSVAPTAQHRPTNALIWGDGDLSSR
jgi:hypothetical protein